MIVLSAKDIKKSYGIEVIIENISFTVQDGDKVGIIGLNGAGKSTLFKILTGELDRDEGEIYIGKNSRLGYMSQDFDFDSENNIWEEMLTVFEDIIQLENSIRTLEMQISNFSSSGKDAELQQLLKSYSMLQEQYNNKDGFSYQSRIRGVLKGLGFTQEEYQQRINTLSGGQKTRVALGKVLLQSFDILLLDEPTNYLDIESVEWLEAYLKDIKSTLLIISHDRYFLDEITNKTFEIENKTLIEYSGNYSRYVELKKERREQLQKEYDLQQKEIERQQAIITRFRQYNREKSIRQAESREKALERMSKIDRPASEPKSARFSFEPRIRSGYDVMFVENLSKTYDRKLFDNISFEIKQGDKVALLGPNGIGKTTILKIIRGMVSPDSGVIRLGKNVFVGYYEQEQESLDPSKLVIDEIWDEYPELNQTDIRTKLAAFLFQGEDVFKEIYKLSGGEKSRVALLKLMLSKSNFLLMDEPTNHLDIVSKEVLESALQNYGGTVLFISHDRYFIKKVANKIIELNINGCTQYMGNYPYYLEKKSQMNDLAQSKDELDSVKASEVKNDWLKQKEEKSNAKRQQKRLETVEKEIKSSEERLKEIEALMELPEVFSDHIRCQELHDESDKLENYLLELYEEWETLQQ
ncbi:MAG: ABC-F family ATP-binding cassette domain-containing protein [Bacillota bacterium]